jgi:hypothetical protein
VVIKIIVPFVGAVPDRRTVGYVIGTAGRLKALLVVLHVSIPSEPALSFPFGRYSKTPVMIVQHYEDLFKSLVKR